MVKSTTSFPYIRKIVVMIIFSFSLISIYSVGIFVKQLGRFISQVKVLKTHYPQVIYHQEDEEKEIRFTFEKPAGWNTLSEISTVATQSIRLSEDWAFFDHKGYDLNEMKESFEKNVSKKVFARGGSTITQQLAKNLFLSQEKTLTRKALELCLSLELEKHFPKKKILEYYLNVIEFGEGLYGIGPASQFYFQKPPSLLRAKEGAFLAMLLPNPKKYSISFRKKQLSAYASKTISNILTKLQKAGYLSEEQYNTEIHTPLNFEQNHSALLEEEEAQG